MIGALRGVIVVKNGAALIIDVGGVGYEVTVSGGVLGRAGRIGEEIKLVVYTDVKETAINLYGFSNQLEREVFLLLKKVKGIGSRQAMNILSSLGAEDILSTIGQQNVTDLQKIPGVGKKTAERIVVELRERVGEYAEILVQPLGQSIEVQSFKGNSVPGLPGIAGDTVLALEKLGFAPDKAKLAVQAALQSKAGKASTTGELLRQALAEL